MNNAFDIACKEKYLHYLFSIVEYDYEPILMVLRDDSQKLFLGLCSELRGMRRWIVALTNVQVLRGLLDFKYTINEALKAVSNTAYVIERHGNEYSFERIPFNQVNPLYLAEEGVYAEFTDEDCEENLAKVEAEYGLSNAGCENLLGYALHGAMVVAGSFYSRQTMENVSTMLSMIGKTAAVFQNRVYEGEYTSNYNIPESPSTSKPYLAYAM